MVIDRQQIGYITVRKQSAPKLRWPTFLPSRPAPFNAVREAQMRITREAWLAMEMLSASPLCARAPSG